MAGLTRLELAASCVTGMRSNQLNYNPDLDKELQFTSRSGRNPLPTMSYPKNWAIQDSNL